MNTLNLGSDEIPEKKKKSNTRNLKIALGLAAVILVPTIGSTLAGSIAIGTGTVEFGQGVVTTAACDTAITVTPTSELTAGTFNIANIAITDVDDVDCDNKFFTIKVLSGSTPQIIGTDSETACKFKFVIATPSIIAPSGGGGCTVVADSSTSDGFTIATGVTLAASLVDKITIESTTA